MKINIERTINFSSSALGLVSSYFFIKGAFSLTSKNIADWSSRWYDVNIHLIQNFVGQKIDFIFGAIFLLLSFILGLLPLFLDSKYLRKKIFNKRNTVAVILGIMVILLVISHHIQNVLVKNQVNKIVNLANEK